MSEANTPVDEGTLHGKFIAAKRNLIGDVQLADISRMVAAAGGWESPDAAELQKAFVTISVPLHKLAESKNDQEAYDEGMKSLDSLNTILRAFVQKYKDAPIPISPT